LGVFEAMSRHSLTERNFKKWMKMLLVKSPYYNKVNTQVCEFRKLFGNVDVDLNPQGSLKLIPIPYEELKETEEYKQTVSEMKSQLGKKYIRLDTIADCILRLPTVELQYAALQQVNTLLSGTAWSEKAAEVLETMFAKVKEQQDRQEQKQDKILDSMEKAATKPTTQNIYGDKNEFQGGAQLLKMGIPEGADPAEIAARIAEQQKQIEMK